MSVKSEQRALESLEGQGAGQTSLSSRGPVSREVLRNPADSLVLGISATPFLYLFIFYE